MNLAKCLIDFPVGDEDLAAIRKLMGKSKDETRAVEKFARSLEKDLDGLRKQLADKGYDVEPGAEGRPQLVIPGAGQASAAAMAQRGADAPLRPTAPQKGMETGLFGDGHKQAEMFAKPRGGSLAAAPSRNAGGTGQFNQSPALTRLMDIANDLVDALDGIVRQGRISNPKALGIYKSPSGVVRVRKPDDFDVLSHELGHHLEDVMGAPVKALMKAHAAELKPMAYQGAKKGTELEEGFAEFVRLMLTNPRYAATQAPNFDRNLRAALSQGEFAPLGKAIDDAQVAYRAWLDQPSTEAVASTIVSSKEKSSVAKARAKLDRYGLGHTISDYLSRAYEGLFDDFNSLTVATRFLAKQIKDTTGAPVDIKVGDDPAKMAQMSRGAWHSGHVDITHGVHPYREMNPTGPSLRDAIILAMGKPNALSRWDTEMATRFGGYLWSRRALGEWDRFDKGLIPNQPDKLTKGDHELNISEMEASHPQFAQAAKMVHDWARELWRKKYESGLITGEQWEEGLQISDYVPGQRMFDQDYDAVGKGNGPKGSARGGFVKQFRGSRRDVINPLESLMRDAYETNMAIARNDVVKALDRLAKLAGPGGGAIAEAVPVRELKATVIDPLEAVANAARASGMSKQDVIALRDSVEAQIGDEKAAIFRPAIINEKGEPIIFWRDGGELKALRLADGEFGMRMYQSLTAMTTQQQGIWTNLLAKPAAVLRIGITSDPSFILSNFIRDQVQSALFYGKPIKRLALSIQGMGDDLFSTNAARLYNRAGGIMGGATVSGVHEMRVNRDISELRHQGWAGSRLTTLKGLLSLTEISETGTRIANFKIFMAEAKKRGLSDFEAMQEGAWLARDVMNFSRHGSQTGAIAKMVPFMNAALQGLDKWRRQSLAPFFREAVTTEDARLKGEATKFWARVTALGTLSMGLYALNSQHDEFRDGNVHLKATNWGFKVGGEWYWVPKPFESAAILNLFEAGWDAMAMHDPRWSEQYLEGLMSVTMPPDVMEGNPLISTAYGIRTGVDIQSGQQIVPDELKGMEPWLQYTQRTSDVSRKLGEATGLSPSIVDYAFLNHTGTLGRSALSLYDYAASDKPMPGWDDMPFTRRFNKDITRGASSSKAFWDQVSERTGRLEGTRKTWQSMLDAGDEASAADFLATRNERERIWVAAGSIEADARRIHPFIRARNAVQAITNLQRDISDSRVETADGAVEIPRRDRGAASDILSNLRMAEARNALVMMGEPGFADRELIDVTTYHRELAAVSPDLAEALGDRFASAKVLPMSFVVENWPDLEDRLRTDGSIAVVADLAAIAEAEGFELGGFSIPKRERGEVPGFAEYQ